MQNKTVLALAGELVDYIGHYPVYIRSARSMAERKRRQNVQRLMKKKIKLLTADLSQSINLMIRH